MKDKAIPRISSVHHINLLSYETSISCSSLLVFHSLNSFFLFLFSCQALFYHYFCFPAWRDVVWKQRATDHSCAKCICETLLLKVIQEVKMILCNSLFLCHPSFCCDSKLISHRFVSWLFYVHFTCTSVQSSFSFSIRDKNEPWLSFTSENNCQFSIFLYLWSNLDTKWQSRWSHHRRWNRTRESDALRVETRTRTRKRKIERERAQMMMIMMSSLSSSRIWVIWGKSVLM